MGSQRSGPWRTLQARLVCLVKPPPNRSCPLVKYDILGGWLMYMWCTFKQHTHTGTELLNIIYPLVSIFACLQKSHFRWCAALFFRWKWYYRLVVTESLIKEENKKMRVKIWVKIKHHKHNNEEKSKRKKSVMWANKLRCFNDCPEGWVQVYVTVF